MSDSPVLELTSEDLCLDIMFAMTDNQGTPTVESFSRQMPETGKQQAPALTSQPPPPKEFENQNLSLAELASDTETPMSFPFRTPEDPAELPLFLPVKRGLCWRCGHEGHHRATCSRTPIRFCSRCGHRDRMSRSCPCRPWFPEGEKTVLPPPSVSPTIRRVMSRGIQCRLDREASTRRCDRCAGSVGKNSRRAWDQ